MKILHKRKSIFKVILAKVFIIVIALNFVLAGIIMREIMHMQEEMIEAKKESLKQEIKSLMNYMETTTESIKKVFYIIQKQLLENLHDKAELHDLKDIDLKAELLKMELDTNFHDIYIIGNGIVVNSTSKKDLGFDTYSLGSDYKELLLKSLESGDFIQERFDLETITKRFTSWSYQATKDKRYVIELGSYSKIADEMMNMFSERLRDIIKDNKEVISANVWMPHEKWSLIEDSIPFDFNDSLLNLTISRKEDVHMSLCEHDIEAIDYMYLELKDIDKENNAIVISFRTDMTHHKENMGRIVKKQIMFTLIMLFLLVTIIMITTRNFRLMLRDLLKKTTKIAEGHFHEKTIVTGNNEFTTLAEQFNIMVEKCEISFNEINNKSELIKESNEELKQQNEEIITQRDEIEAQRNFAIEHKSIIEKQKEEMVDSINYAQRIQEATLPHEYYVNEILPENFIIFKPRDIVSGDFYWIRQVNEYIIVAAVDCTGHGVPGAIMSILGISLLNEILQHKKIVQPNLILNELRKQVKRSLRQSGKAREASDGMDIALCSVNSKTNELQYAGAFNPLLILRNKEIIEFKADRMPVGIYIKEKPTFTNHKIKLEPGDTMYIFSDGYADQMGGKDGKKFKIAKLKKLLLENHEYSLVEQREILETTLEKWMKGHDQIDDILFIGFRVI